MSELPSPASDHANLESGAVNAPPQGSMPPRRGRRILLQITGVILLLLLAISIILPQLCRAREPANRIKCASNLKQIGLWMQMYANSHQGNLPASLQDLLAASDDLTADVLICPSSGNTVATGPTTRAAIAATAQPGHCSYIYLGAGLTWSNDAAVVLAYEPLADHKNDGMNVLFGDAHVEYLKAPGVLPWIAATRNGPVRDPRSIATTQP